MRRVALACAVLGIGLRFAWIGEPLLWHDEVYTRFFAGGSQAEDWKPVLFTGEILDVEDVIAAQRPRADRGIADTIRGLAHDEPQHPPFYYAIARLWTEIFGEGIGALRALSALSSLLALPAAWWLIREISDEEDAAWAGGALLSVSPFFVLYAREAREYALWSALVLASSAALLSALRTNRLGMWALYSGLVALSLYTSFSTVAVVAAHVVAVVVLERGPTRGAFSAAGAMAAAGLLFLPWAMALMQHFEAFQASMAWSKTIVIPRADLLSTLALNLSRPVLDFWPGLSPAAWAGIALFGAIFGLALWDLRRETMRAWAMLGALFIVPIAMLLGPDLIWGGIRSISTRYLTPTLLAVELILALSLSRRPALLGVALIVGAASSLWNVVQIAPWTKGISTPLPIVAEAVNAADRPLLVGNLERHNPGNLLAICHILKPGTKVQFLPVDRVAGGYEPPPGYDIFLFGPIPPFTDDLEARGFRSERVYEDIYASLWSMESR